jgi:hypothetical protein
MKMEKTESSQSDDLRQKAEEYLKDGQSDQDGSTITDDWNAMALIHELQVHQIELDMQNEELKHAKLETENALMKYSDIYDFAPVGLFTVCMEGLISRRSDPICSWKISSD